MEEFGLDRIDGIVYINLAIRSDRNRKMLEEFKKLELSPERYHRIEGCYDEVNGARGCAFSHTKALSFAIEKGWKNVLVLEDDCRFIKPNKSCSDYIENFFSCFDSRWDVFFLGTNTYVSAKTNHPDYLRVIFSTRAHSYIVNGHYMEILQDQFYKAYNSMKQDLFYITSVSEERAIDLSWSDLQKSDRWYAGVDMIAVQAACYSDIEKSMRPQR